MKRKIKDAINKRDNDNRAAKEGIKRKMGEAE